jgi:hypothetical protein
LTTFAIYHQSNIISRVQTELAVFSNQPQLKETEPVWADNPTEIQQNIAAQRAAVTQGLDSLTPGELFAKVFPVLQSRQTSAPKLKRSASPQTGEAISRRGSGTQARPDSRLSQQPNVTVDLTMPEKFIIQGDLAAVRQVESRTFVFLRMGGKENSEKYYSRSAADPPMTSWFPSASALMPDVIRENVAANLLCVIFEGNVARHMADYRVGESVSVAVHRRRWMELQTGPNTGLLPSGGQTDSSVNRLAKDHPDLARAESQRSTLQRSQIQRRQIGVDNPYGPEFCRFGDKLSGGESDLFWCFAGDGIEKSGEPTSWIDPSLGRGAQITNDAEVDRSFGTILRDSGKLLAGAHGVLEARFAGLLFRATSPKWNSDQRSKSNPIRPKGSDLVLVLLTVPDSVEGPLTIIADLGSQTKAADFDKYRVETKNRVGTKIQVQVDAGDAQLVDKGSSQWLDRVWPLPDPVIPGRLKEPISDGGAASNYQAYQASRRSASMPRQVFYRQLQFDPLVTPIIIRCKSFKIKK